jgi:hypothetical protein
MRKIVFVITPVLSVLAGVGAFGQDAPPPVRPIQAQAAGAPAQVSPCPRIDVQSSGQRGVREGQVVTLMANIQGGDPKVTPQIIWSVNGGVIKDGQETRKVDVDTTGAGSYREITADVWVGGYSGECQSQASATVRVIPPANKADEFGELAPEKENERLATIASALSQSDDQMYIIAYAGRTSARGHVSAALKRMRTQLLATGFDANRLIVLDGGFREQPAFELWVVPQGSEAPKAAPTVDRREIVHPKTTPAPSKKPARP